MNPMSLHWPFIVGTLFLLLILGIVVFGGDPTPWQFAIYRIIIALGGAGFAVALTGHLQIQFPLFGRGYIKAAAAFAVFVILYFFTPAALAVDKGEMESKRLLDEYKFANSEVVEARRHLSSIWTLEGKGETLARLAAERTRKSIEQARDLVRETFGDAAARDSFATITDFHSRLFNCVNSGLCDPKFACHGFLKEVEAFKNLYCDRIIEISSRFKNQLWSSYRNFSETTCKRDFLEMYVNYKKPSDLKNICIPVQCWARHTTPPFPCDAGSQLINGVKMPV